LDYNEKFIPMCAVFYHIVLVQMDLSSPVCQSIFLCVDPVAGSLQFVFPFVFFEPSLSSASVPEYGPVRAGLRIFFPAREPGHAQVVRLPLLFSFHACRFLFSGLGRRRVVQCFLLVILPCQVLPPQQFFSDRGCCFWLRVRWSAMADTKSCAVLGFSL
jgi:hypothetical protein